jgi:hypothetical protein
MDIDERQIKFASGRFCCRSRSQQNRLYFRARRCRFVSRARREIAGAGEVLFCLMGHGWKRQARQHICSHREVAKMPQGCLFFDSGRQGLQLERIICYRSIEERWHAEVYFAQVNTGLNPVSPVLPDSDLLPGV